MSGAVQTGSGQLAVHGLPKGPAATWLQPIAAMQECGLCTATAPDFSRESGILDIYVEYLHFKMSALVSSLRPVRGPKKTSIQANHGQVNAGWILVQCVLYSGGH